MHPASINHVIHVALRNKNESKTATRLMMADTAMSSRNVVKEAARRPSKWPRL